MQTDDELIEQLFDTHGSNFVLIASLLNQVNSKVQRTAAQVFYHWREKILPKRLAALTSAGVVNKDKEEKITTPSAVKAQDESLVSLLRSYLVSRRPIDGYLNQHPDSLFVPRHPPLPPPPQPKVSNPLALINAKPSTTPTPESVSESTPIMSVLEDL